MSVKARFEQGNKVGELSRVWHTKAHGPAVYIEDLNFDIALAKTKDATKAGALALHEAAFRSPAGVRVRVDLMHRPGKGMRGTSKRSNAQLGSTLGVTF